MTVLFSESTIGVIHGATRRMAGPILAHPCAIEKIQIRIGKTYLA